MTRERPSGEDIRHFILGNIAEHPTNISKLAATKFSITRQAVSKHLKKLVSQGALTESGQTRNRSYKLATLQEWRQLYQTSVGLAEDVVWTKDVAPTLGHQPENVLDIWQYGLTEIFNNAIDHSGGSQIGVHIKRTAITTEMVVFDNGIGIFNKIQTALNLLDERHAVLELSKGKLTTDPRGHTGEGIFFASRMFDSFDILSGGVYFSHVFTDSEDWIMERDQFKSGTFVWMKLHNHTSRTTKKIFDQYTSQDGEFSFSKTVVPVRLAQYGNDKLISRSQAKRVLARVESFSTVLFDFTGVPTIGQAFADEIFRVFAQEHPRIEIHPIHANSEVRRMIGRVQSVR